VSECPLRVQQNCPANARKTHSKNCEQRFKLFAVCNVIEGKCHSLCGQKSAKRTGNGIRVREKKFGIRAFVATPSSCAMVSEV